MLVPGAVVADKYRVERVLGRGGMGMVVEATHVQLGTPFALKFLNRSVADNASATERFLREARATAALRSEHVCRVFDVGTHEGAPYLVMEKLEGTDLLGVLRRARRLPIDTACGYLIQACAGIAEAHALKIVHRDLKPSNLFLTTRPDGSPLVKVLDFGIAKGPRDRDLELTGTDTILGSPSYMSLEQLRSSKLVDTRSDIWSLGVILFELVSGRRPFIGEGVADLVLKIAMEPMPKLSEAPHPLDPVIVRCLAIDPAARFQDVAALAAALAPFATPEARKLVAPMPRVAHSPAPGVATVDAGNPTAVHAAGAIEGSPVSARARSRAGLIGVVAAAILGGTVSGILVSRSGRGGGEVPVTARDKPAAIDAAEPPDAAIVGVPTASIDAAVADAAVADAAVADAAVADAAVDGAEVPAVEPQEVKRPPRVPPKRPPKKPPSVEDLGKSRI